MTEQPKKLNLPLIAASAVLGLGVGAAVANQWFLCPEARYPACYKQMVENGFMPSERLQYVAEPNWGEDSFSVAVKGPILCDYNARVALMVPEKGVDNIVRPTEKFSTKVTFERGVAVVKDIPREFMSVEQGSALTVALLADDEKEFDIVRVLGEDYTKSLVVIPLKVSMK